VSSEFDWIRRSARTLGSRLTRCICVSAIWRGGFG
jgi:hypothetical protein